MPQRGSKNFFSRFFRSPLFSISALVVSFFFLFAFVRNYIEDYNIRREIVSLKEDVQALETKKIQSLEILDYVMSDAFVEEKARVEFNLKKPGEQVVVFKHSPEVSVPVVGEPVEDYPLNRPLKWWYYFTTHRLPESSI